MKVRIYKAGGNTGRFISKLDKFLPTAAKGLEVEKLKQLKSVIKYQLDEKNKSENSIVLELVRGGYDYNYSKDLVESIANEIEEEYYNKKKSKTRGESVMDSELIPNDEDTSEDEAENKDRLRRKMMSQNMQDDIAQTAEDTDDEDSDDEAYDEEVMNEPSPFEDDLNEASFGLEVSDSKITWPGMYNDLASMKKGGVPNKSKFIKSTVKKLKKAEKGMQKDPSADQMPNPFGTINNPLGIDTTPNKALINTIKNTAQEVVTEKRLKEEAEQIYNQNFLQPNMPTAEEGGSTDWATNLHNYGESLSHSMPSMNTTGMNTSFNDQEMSFGGSSRRVRRANKAFFGLPIAPPGVKTDYQFGPFGGLKRGQVEWDMAALAQALKDNPQLSKMLMPNIGMGMPSGRGIWNWWTGNIPVMNFGNVFGGSYGGGYGSSSSYSYGTPKTRLKWATEVINNAADPGKNMESAKLKNNPIATSGSYGPGYEGFNADSNGNGIADYLEVINPQSTNTGVSSNTSPSNTLPLNKPASVQNKPASVQNKPASVQNKPKNQSANSNNNSAVIQTNNNTQSVKPTNEVPNEKTKKNDQPKEKNNQPKAKTYVDDSKDDGLDAWDYIKLGSKLLSPFFNQGGFVDFDRPDLNRFIYGGDDYEYGGDIKRFAPGGPNQVDPNYRDAGGRNYQDYIDWYGSTSVDKGMSRQAPQTYAEWKAEQDAERKPAGTGTGTNTTGTGATNYDQAYFQNMFKNDPKFKQGFEQFLQSQGLPTNNQLKQQGNFQWTNNQGTPLVGVGPASKGFGSGIGKFFGFNKDFNAYYSPQGQITREMIAQAMKNPANKVTETKFTDKGKRWNPWDTKEVTEWTVNSATGQPTPPAINTTELSGRDRRIARRDERLNRNTPAESDAYQFTSTLTGSQETPVKEPMSNEEMLKSQGRVWDEKQQKWLPKPSGMAYGGYMPDYGYGGMMYYDPGGPVVGPNPDFAGPQQNDFAKDADGNGIPDYLEVKDSPAADDKPFKYRLEEETARSWDPKQTAIGVDKTLSAATDVIDAANFAKSREKENAKYMYAQDIDRQLTYKGITDEQGIDKKAGFESGRTYIGQYGGAKYAKGGNTYTKGKVYSLTMDEINEIKRRGGSVKFIK